MQRTRVHPWQRPLGAVALEDGLVEFRVWAPNSASVAIELRGEEHELTAAGEGVFEGELFADPGDEYRFRLDDGTSWPDPVSRCQPDGVRGPSRVVDTRREFAWTDDARPGLRLEDLVVYELHVGTFSAEGTFEGAIPHLAALRDLGVTAIELMPVAAFPGSRGWGYDGLYIYAPQIDYGGPTGLARLVDAAHAAGLGVILDVVYNHVGPGNEALRAFGPYFTDRHETFWGDAINYDGEGSGAVREWAIQNAEYWVRDLHVDGLRLDAVHAIVDESPRHVLAELAERVHAIDPRTLVISEMEIGNMAPIRDWGHDAQWEDSLHHAVHTLLTGEREGYYESFGRVADLAAAYARPEGRRLVVCAQNHDQVGNRAVGDRLTGQRLRLAAFAVLLSPFTPLLFQGEEYGETRPFQFFTDHIDPFIADATREGRRREFEAFSSFSGEEVPDPQAEEMFMRSKLDRAGGDEETRRLYRDLLRVRRALPRESGAEASYDEDARWLRLPRGDHELLLNFADEERRLPADAAAELVLETGGATLAGGEVRLPPLAGALLARHRKAAPGPSPAGDRATGANPLEAR